MVSCGPPIFDALLWSGGSIVLAIAYVGRAGLAGERCGSGDGDHGHHQAVSALRLDTRSAHAQDPTEAVRCLVRVGFVHVVLGPVGTL